MEKQELLNAIATLASSIDPLVRAEQKEAITKVVAKMLELIGKLKCDDRGFVSYSSC